MQPKNSAVLLNIAPSYIPYMKEAVSVTSIIFSTAVFVFFAKVVFAKLSLVKEKVTQRNKTKRKLRLLSYTKKPGWGLEVAGLAFPPSPSSSLSLPSLFIH